MTLSHKEYLKGLGKGLYVPPQAFHPYYAVDPPRHTKLKADFKDSSVLSTTDTFRELKRRTSRRWFAKIERERAWSYAHGQRVAPAFEFLLPEVVADDWLATVGWHKTYYRDHLLHQPLTTYVVLELLTGGGDPTRRMMLGTQSLLSYCVGRILKGRAGEYLSEYLAQFGLSPTSGYLPSAGISYLWELVFVEAAYLAALFHDIGYPWKFVDALEANLGLAGYTPTVSGTGSSHLVSRLIQRLVFAPLRGYRAPDPSAPLSWPDELEGIVEQCRVKTHGLSGAVGFLHLFDALRKYPNPAADPVGQLCVEWAAMAILMHDVLDVYWGRKPYVTPSEPGLRIHIDQDPLSAVLVLADTIQEFCRPPTHFHRKKDEDVLLTYRDQGACVETDVSFDSVSKKLTISYGYKNTAAQGRQNNYMGNYMNGLGLDAALFDSGVGLVNLSPAGIDDVELVTHHVP